MGIKYQVNENFFKEWSPVMAYLLGFIYADGCIYRSVRGHYLVVTSVDKFILERTKEWMKSSHTIQSTPPTRLNGREQFRLRIGNKQIYEDIVRLGVYPSKSLTVRMPCIPDTFLKDFVRGNFDGDGCAYFERSHGKTQDLIIRRMSAIFTSGSELFLGDLLAVLKQKIDLKQENIYRSRRAFQLRFGTADSVEVFKFMYGNTPRELFFMRKFEVFERYFASRPTRIDKEVRSILDYSVKA